MSKYIIALDQSTKITGYSIYKDNSKLIKYGKIEPKGELIHRIIELRDWLKELILGLKEEKQEVELVLEEIQLQNIPGTNREGNIATFKKLAYVQAILLELAIDLNISYTIIPSSVWKSECGIKGSKRNEQKKNAQNFVQNKYKINATQDESDAICIGLTYCMQHAIEDEGWSWEN